MISRKRIGELIEKESGCYVLNDGNIGYVHLKLKYEPELYVNGEDGYILYIYCNDRKEYKEEIFDEDLFETQEEAEWHKEFGCIERTERLELPTWEEFGQSEKLIRFIGKFGQKCKIEGYFNLDLHSGFIDVTENGSSQINLPEYNKENYTLACRKAKELFLGENDD